MLSSFDPVAAPFVGLELVAVGFGNSVPVCAAMGSLVDDAPEPSPPPVLEAGFSAFPRPVVGTPPFTKLCVCGPVAIPSALLDLSPWPESCLPLSPVPEFAGCLT